MSDKQEVKLGSKCVILVENPDFNEWYLSCLEPLQDGIRISKEIANEVRRLQSAKQELVNLKASLEEKKELIRALSEDRVNCERLATNDGGGIDVGNGLQKALEIISKGG